MKTAKASHSIRTLLLKKAFDRAREQNSKFSVRSLALKLSLSPGFVSKILSGKSGLPLERLELFCEALKIDEITKQELLKTFQPEGIQGSSKPSKTRNFEEYGEKNHHLLDEWYYVAIMDLLTCSADGLNVEGVASRLKLDKSKVQRALGFLRSQGLVKEEADGFFQKTKLKMRLPTSISKEKIRNYHATMMEKAIQNLKKTSQEDFNKRLIAGISIAADSSKIDEIRLRLHNFIYELAEEFADGNCDQVYHLAVQLFPVSEE